MSLDNQLKSVQDALDDIIFNLRKMGHGHADIIKDLDEVIMYLNIVRRSHDNQ